MSVYIKTTRVPRVGRNGRIYPTTVSASSAGGGGGGGTSEIVPDFFEIENADLTGTPTRYVCEHNRNTDRIVPTLYDDKGRVVTNIIIQKDPTDSKNKLIIWIPITISGTWLLIVQWWPE